MQTCSNSFKAVVLTSELVVWAVSLVFLSLLRLMFPLDKHTLGHPVRKKKDQLKKGTHRTYEFKLSRINPGVVN